MGQVLESRSQCMRHLRPKTWPHFLTVTAGSGGGSVMVVGPVGWAKGSRHMVHVGGHSSVEMQGQMAVSRAQGAQLVAVAVDI